MCPDEIAANDSGKGRRGLPPIEFRIVDAKEFPQKKKVERSAYMFDLMQVGDVARVNRHYRALIKALWVWRKKPENQGKRFSVRQDKKGKSCVIRREA